MTLRAYLALLRPHAPAMVVAGGLLGATGAAPGLAVWLLRAALDQLSRGAAAELGWTAAALVALTAVQAVAVVARTAITRSVSASIASDLRRRLHAAFLADAGSVGDRLSALTDEVDQVQYGVSGLVTAIRNPVALAGLVGTAVALAPSLAAWAIAVLGLAVGLGIGLSRWVRRAVARARAARAALSTTAAEQLGAIEVIRAFAAEGGEGSRFAAVDADDRAARSWLEVIRVLPSSGVELVAAIGLGAVLIVGGRQIAAGTLEPSALVAAAFALVLASRPLSGLAEVWSLIQRSLVALDRVERVLGAVPVRASGVGLPDGPLAIRWDAVTVVRGGRPIVDRVSAAAEPGVLVGVVGATGAGKTTLLRTALGVVRTDAGRVTIGGVDLEALDDRALRAAIAVVPQDGALFARSVADNVALGVEPPVPERVEAALDAAGAGFVRGWPAGIGTVLAVRFLTVAVMLGVSCGIAWRVAQIVAAALGG
ncbi:MAG: ABC transporter ATP-binding protein [Myxococcota bacterium]